jgi:hypothetical protein
MASENMTYSVIPSSVEYDTEFPRLPSREKMSLSTSSRIKHSHKSIHSSECTTQDNITAVVKSLCGDLYSLPCSEHDAMDVLSYKFHSLYSDKLSFRPLLIREEENTYPSSPMEDGEMIFMVPFPSDYGATIQFVTNELYLIAESPNYTYDYLKDPFHNIPYKSIAIYEAIVFQGGTRIYFPFLVCRNNHTGKTLFSDFHYNYGPRNQRAVAQFRSFIEKRKQEATIHSKNGSGWESKIVEFANYNYENNDYCIFGNPRVSLYSIEKLLILFQCYYLPESNAITAYWNQFLFHAFSEGMKQEFPECF